ncbi:YheC/YheD family protein [Bacillus sp. Bos-x628]|uniref:YheC/YheD family endospore coat-associated protein n=1 Tax=Bacillus maqinnsis TaxID=3229854 RepID=UPI00338EA7C1
MLQKRCIIAPHLTSKRTIHLPFQFKQQESIQSIAFGSLSLDGFTISYHQNKHKMLLSEDLFHDLLIPYETKADVILHDNTLYIGPLIGIFTAGFEQNAQPLGTRSDFFVHLLKSCRKHVGFAYLFGTHSIDWDQGIVEGYLFQQQKWLKKQFPLPTVIYDRLPNRKVAQSAFIQETKRKLTQDYDIPWFNPYFFNKWHIHEKLLADQRSVSFLPHSIQLDPLDASCKIETLLHLHNVIYLKPMNGSHGHDIYQLKTTKSGINVYTNKGMSVEFYSVEEFLEKFRKEHTIHEFIAQQGIDLLHIENQPLDFRVHTNKNKYGYWTVTAIAAKVSGDHTVTTHHLHGGTVKTLTDIFHVQETRLKILQQLSETAIHLSQVIDEKMPGFIGEIGFDLGIDHSGSTWMFEANSRPGREIFRHSLLKNSEWLVGKRIVDYASYLSQKALFITEHSNVN